MSTTALPAEPLPEIAAEPLVAVSAKDLVRRYGQGDTSVEALRGVSLEVAEGRLTATDFENPGQTPARLDRREWPCFAS